MCILGAGSKTFPANPETLYAFRRPTAKYKGFKYIRTAGNSLFVHQFSHAFIDFRGKKDMQGTDWFKNSVQASLGHRQYCIDNPENSKTYSANSWGLSASHSKYGYTGAFGALPVDKVADLKNDGTIALYAAPSSIVFTPKESLAVLKHYGTIPKLWGRYGLVDSYNLDEEPPYFDPYFLGLDKGITLAMFANYENEFVWKYFMKNEYVKRGLKAVGIQKGKKAEKRKIKMKDKNKNKEKEKKKETRAVK
jgi:hypothetical protein